MSITNVNAYYGMKQSVKHFSGLTMNDEGGFSFKEESLEGGFAYLVNPEEFQRKWMEQNNNQKVDYYFDHSVDVEKEDQRVKAYLQMKYVNAANAKQDILGRNVHIQRETINDNSLGGAVEIEEKEEEGEFLGLTMIPEEGQSMTYGMRAMLPESSISDKPIVQIVSNLGGKKEVYNVDISKIDPKNASQIEMFALCSYADKKGLSNLGAFGAYQKIKCYADNAQTNGYCKDLDGVGNFLHAKLNWKEIVSKMMADYLNAGIYKQYQDGVNLLGLFDKF